MKATARELHDADVIALDGPIGKVEDVYFDDRQWVACALLVNGGDLYAGRRLLIDTASVDLPRSSDTRLLVRLTRAQVKQAALSGLSAAHGMRSCNETLGSAIQARDGAAGQLQDFLFERARWTIRDIVVAAQGFWLGGHALVATESVERIDWGARRINVRLNRAQVKARRADPAQSALGALR